jgi:hypothetical protein
MMYAVERPPCDIILLPSLMKNDTGFQELLRFCLRNLSGSNVGISDRRDLWSAPLRLLDVE